MTIGDQDVYRVILLEGLINAIYPDAPRMNINLHKQNVLGPSCTVSPILKIIHHNDADEQKILQNCLYLYSLMPNCGALLTTYKNDCSYCGTAHEE